MLNYKQLLGCLFLFLLLWSPNRATEDLSSTAIEAQPRGLLNTCPTNDMATLQSLAGLIGGILGWTLNLITCLLPPPNGVVYDGRCCVVGLSLVSSALQGTLPLDVGNLVNLVNLTITGTKYTLLPSTFSKLKNLRILDLSNNKLTGGLSYLAAANLSQVTSINLKGNLFSSLPVFGALPQLLRFDASNNNISSLVAGATWFLKAPLLQVVNLASNTLTQVPFLLISTLNSLNNLVSVVLSSNLMSGLLLDLIQFLASLPLNIILDLSNNFFCGLIPPLASRIIDPSRLILNNNCFFNPLPNWCKLYSNTCRFMKPEVVCDPITSLAYCPPVSSGNQTRPTQTVETKLQDGPQIFLLPINGSGTHASVGITLRVTQVAEIDNSGNALTTPNATQLVPAQIFKRYYVDNLDNSERFGFRISTILDNGAFFFWEIFVANQTFTKNYVTIDRSISSNVVSQLMEVSYWPGFNTGAVGVMIKFELDLGSQINSYNNMSLTNLSSPIEETFTGADNGTYTSFQFGSEGLLIANVTLINLAFGNNNQSYNITHKLSYKFEDGSLASLQALIPFKFFPSMFYDPDLGTTFGGSYNGDGDGDGTVGSGDGDGFKDAYIAAIVAPVALVAIAVPAVIVTIAVILAVKKASLAAWLSSSAGVEGAVHL